MLPAPPFPLILPAVEGGSRRTSAAANPAPPQSAYPLRRRQSAVTLTCLPAAEGGSRFPLYSQLSSCRSRIWRGRGARTSPLYFRSWCLFCPSGPASGGRLANHERRPPAPHFPAHPEEAPQRRLEGRPQQPLQFRASPRTGRNTSAINRLFATETTPSQMTMGCTRMCCAQTAPVAP